MLPLHHVVVGAREAIVHALLATAAQAAMAAAGNGPLPLHGASSEAAAHLLLAAAPAAAMVRDVGGRLPIDVQLENGCVEAAHAVLPATETHAALAAIVAAGEVALPLFADVACQRQLNRGDWQLVPTPCAVLGAALPAVARRSRAEAGQVVRRLLPAERGACGPLPCASPASCQHPCVRCRPGGSVVIWGSSSGHGQWENTGGAPNP